MSVKSNLDILIELTYSLWVIQQSFKSYLIDFFYVTANSNKLRNRNNVLKMLVSIILGMSKETLFATY